MSSLPETVALATVATLPAVYTGLLIGYLLCGKHSYNVNPASQSGRTLVLSAVATGLTFWFFLDIMAESTFLGINQALGSGMTLELVILFAIGFLATVMLEPKKNQGRLYNPIFLGAVVIGLHGIGEGTAIGSVFTYAVDPIAVVGGPLSASSFVIHKMLEAFIVSVVAVEVGLYFSHLLAAGLIIGLPTIVGAVAGYFFSPNATIFFALGGGATIWLISTLLATSMAMQSRFKWSLAVLAGVIIMFLAGTLHSL